MVRDLEAIADVQGFWEKVCLTTGMQKNALKVQVWYCSTWTVKHVVSTQGVVLGAVLGPRSQQDPTPDHLDRSVQGHKIKACVA